MTEDYRKACFENYFESAYKHGNVFNREQLVKAAEAFERDYRGLLPEARDAAILDIGCGAGHFLYFLEQQKYLNYHGIDVSAQQVAFCREHASERVEQADSRDFLQDKAGRYDVITAHDVLEHISKEEVLPFLHSVREALRPGGTFIGRVPNMSNPFGLDARYNDFTHEIGYTAKSLYQVMSVAGFADVRVLSSRVIPVRSVRSWIRRGLVGGLHGFIRFCYYIQDYAVPKNLDKNLIVVVKREG